MTTQQKRSIGLGTWVTVGIGLVVIVFGAAFASRFNREPNMVASPMIGRAPPAIAMPYLEKDGELALPDLRVPSLSSISGRRGASDARRSTSRW